MGLYTKQENIEFFKGVVAKYEPYPMDIYEEMTSYFDGKNHDGDTRYVASMCLKALLKMGFKEEEVNPWLKKEEE